jgi:hypothetical protein
MSSSKSKKLSIEEAMYKARQKVYVIGYHKDLPEELFEGVVVSIISQESIIGTSFTETSYQYQVDTVEGILTEVQERVYPNYTEAAKVFAKHFLKPLK